MSRIGVIGAGVLGGSIALAAKRAGHDVVVYDTNQESMRDAAAAGLGVAQSPGAACAARDLVVLATPVDQLMVVAPMIRPFLEPDTVVTEVGSVKSPSRGLIEALSSNRVAVVPSHPMAGSERFGFSNATPTLIDGCTWLVCADEKDPAANRLAAFIEAIGGGRSLRCALDAHDIVVGVVSHLPQMVSSLLAASVKDAVDNYANGAFSAAGGGFRDTTRIADSPISMWRPVIEGNRAMIATLLEDMATRTSAVAEALRKGDMVVVDELFSDAHAARDAWRTANPGVSPVVENPSVEPSRWADSNTGGTAWLDGTLGWETVRTDAADPLRHAEIVARFLAAELGLSGEPVVRGKESNHLRVARALEGIGAPVSVRETWTADGLHVGGVEAAGRFFVVA